MKARMWIVSAAALAVCLAASANLLTNPDFEAGDVSGWSSFGVGFRTGTGGDAHSGTYGLVDDVLTGDAVGDEWRGVFQTVAVTGGETYDYTAWERALMFGNASEAWLELQWYDSAGGQISQVQSTHVSANQDYTLVSLTNQLAPGAAVTANVRAVVHRTTYPIADNDFHTFDDFSFTAVPEPGTLALFGLGIVGLWRLGRKVRG